ncbi:MAG TPA: SUMF1/EgtB/PvdO family nonheme iron enzyme [Phototrophicaceae bacterium]|nr:SUMF1/EgtB/PvdO family nonheme iron enzyme [Phototrophicaceae bacterium]
MMQATSQSPFEQLIREKPIELLALVISFMTTILSFADDTTKQSIAPIGFFFAMSLLWRLLWDLLKKPSSNSRYLEDDPDDSGQDEQPSMRRLRNYVRLFQTDPQITIPLNHLWQIRREIPAETRNHSPARELIRKSWFFYSTLITITTIVVLLWAAGGIFVGLSGYQFFSSQAARSQQYSFKADTAKLGNPPQFINLPAFSIDLYEVSNWQYRRCMGWLGPCTNPVSADFEDPTKDNFPVQGVSGEQALVFCNWVRRRLPTIAEWERAALGLNLRPWPWSDKHPNEPPDSAFVNALIAKNQNTPIGPVAVDDVKYGYGATDEGIMHLVGNVWEWNVIPTSCQNDPYCTTFVTPANSAGAAFYVRGFGWETTLTEVSTSNPSPLSESVPFGSSEKNSDFGFRCAS